ncbi:MAG: cache domain-containing protein [Burkholderiaceae bacterium]|nr:cache domain-containing protein [Burkholderiaceae bacterium]
MKTFFKWALLALYAMAWNPAAHAADKATRDDAVALIRKAAAYLNAHGKEKAAAAFNDAKGEFVDRDLYVYAADLTTGVAWAHGVNPRIVGKSMLELRDADGKYFVKELLEVAKSKGRGWVDYKWPNPVSTILDAKTTYVEKVGNNVLACGVYK